MDNIEIPATETLEEKVARLEREKGELQTAHDELAASSAEEIGNLSEALDKAKKVADVADPTITDGKDEYSVIGKEFTYTRKGEVEARKYTLAELLKDKLLQKELIGLKAGFLKKK